MGDAEIQHTSESALLTAGWRAMESSRSDALFHDPHLMARSGQVLVAAAVAKEFGVLDIDGSSPPALTLADI